MLGSVMINLVFFIIYVLGLIVCINKLKVNRIFKYGLWFFSLRIVISVLDTARNLAIPMIFENVRIGARTGLILSLSNLPSLLLGIIAYIVLIIGFYVSFRYDANQNYQ